MVITMRVPAAWIRPISCSTAADAPGSRLARRIADEILFIDSGKLVEQTPADRFFGTPGSEEARLFLDGELP